MASFQDNINGIQNDFVNIKNSIIAKGVNISNNTPTSQFASKIDEISQQSEGGGSSSDSPQPNPTWWDIKTIVENDENIGGFSTVYIALLTDEEKSTTFNIETFGGHAFKTSDGAIYNTSATHTWNVNNDKQCIINGHDSYKTRYVIVYARGLTNINLYANIGIKSIYILKGDIGEVSMGNMTVPNIKHCLEFFESTIDVSLTIGKSNNGGFAYCRTLRSIKIKSGTSTILDKCFYYCSALKEIELPSNITSLGEYAFGYCSSLRSINLPYNITTIGVNCFAYCYSLESIILNNNIISIGGNCFYYCYSLTSVELLPNISAIGSNSFYNCTSIYDFKIYSDFDIDINISDAKLSPTVMIPIINILKNNTGGASKNLIIGSLNLNKLTTEQKAVATNKNWTLA